MTKISLKVNGQLRTVDADPDTPLAYVLRNQLRLTGTKIGCSKEQCGACEQSCLLMQDTKHM